MMSDDEFDDAIKSAARTAVRLNLTGETLREYADREARAYCEGEPVCSLGMAASILDYHARLLVGPKLRAWRGEPVMFRTDYNGEPIALFFARPGPTQVLDMAAFSPKYGWVDVNLSSWHDETTPITSEGETRLRASLDGIGVPIHEVHEPTSEMDEIRRARANGTLPEADDEVP